MKNALFILALLLFFQNSVAQKVIYSPVHDGISFPATLTKIELTDSETILYFKMQAGTAFIIPDNTHIIDALNQGQKLFVTKAVGLNITDNNFVNNSTGMLYKLYFPPVSHEVTHINYGERGFGESNWAIKNIDISNSDNYIFKTYAASPNTDEQIIGYPITMENFIDIKISEHQEIGLSDLPKSVFGNWHDKYDTLITCITPEFILFNFKIYRYQKLYKTGENTFLIVTSGGDFEVLGQTSDVLTLKHKKILNLKRDDRKLKVPEDLKGNWLHYAGVKKIKITDTYFYNDDTGIPNVNEVENNKIISIGSSSEGELWFLLNNGENYNAFQAKKIGQNYVITPAGFPNAIYRKVE
ncbi:hypothetical protein [uncultured Formosa sp.]|uniref:hypothetical protein n=1 Tax=uncultured Formosa sp. TaxID=255435 RepID=UPI00260CCD32|nr:hypothetical protein [uncultured Formosa sp.]